MVFTTDCVNWVAAVRVDTGPSSTAMVDFTKAMFTVFAPLHQGRITNMNAATKPTQLCC